MNSSKKFVLPVGCDRLSPERALKAAKRSFSLSAFGREDFVVDDEDDVDCLVETCGLTSGFLSCIIFLA